jgi:hypothetical protein
MRNTVHAPGITTATFATEAETSKQPLKSFTHLNFMSRDELLSWAEKRENTCDAF